MKKNQEIKHPIVTVMGHVDHGKTTLIDTIRGSRIAAKEHGGITQNTRAHEVTLEDGFKITFIDTPGHEAFSRMRERGARVTDFVLLVVAADDGVKPQTKESIKFAKDNKVPVIVAINKVDVEGVVIQKIKTELSSFGVVVEEYGGDALCFEVSAKNNTGIKELLEGIKLMSEINELKPSKTKEGTVAEAFVLESTLEKNVGYSALCILKAGKLSSRGFGVSGEDFFRVRAYIDENGKQIKEVSESQPFTVLGLKEDLKTGEMIYFVETDKDAKEFIENSKQVEEMAEESEEEQNTENIFEQMLMAREELKHGVEQKKLNLIIRSSTKGTLEAVTTELEKLNTPEYAVKILSSGTGNLTEDDVNFAKISKAILISFQSKVAKDILALAKKNKVLLREYQIIYNLVDEISDVLESLEEGFEEVVEIGRLKVKGVFTLTNGSQVAGGTVVKGVFTRNLQVRVERQGKTSEDIFEVGTSKVKMIKQNKDEVKELRKGQDGGLQLETTIGDLQEGDEVVGFRVEKG